MFGSKERNDTR